MRTIAITGSASGMGAATRKRLESAGDKVIGIASFCCGSVFFVDGGTDALLRPDGF